MADEGGPGKVEMQELFRRLRNIPSNRVCFDCNTKNPTWASVTYGVFICIDCSAVHRSLGVHLTFVRSTQLDTNWTYTQLRNMQLGGNANASAFFSQHNCNTSDAQQKYNSRAAHLYREKLNQIVAKYNKIHGTTVLQLEDEHPKSPTEKESDFFNEIHSAQNNINNLTLDSSTRLTKQSDRFGGGDDSSMKEGPNVSAALTAPPSDSGVRKSTIGQRKPANKLGGKKVGLGAQKVKADFSEIEKEAHMLDQMKEKREEDAKIDAERRAQDQEKQMATMRLAYQDLSKQQRQREEQLKHMDPKKAEQVERLGMGVGVRAGISHSAISDMQTFEQDAPAYGSSKHNVHRKADSFFDDFEIVESSSSGLGSMGGFSSKKTTAADWDFERPSRSKPVEEEISSKPRSSSYKSVSSSGVGDEAQKKFGNAKGISSDQFFGGGKDSESERRTNLSRFDGQTSISSADYFGDGAQRNMQQPTFQSSLQAVDFDDVKDSVRQGVTKVAGKLSNLANGVMSSIQEKYGY